MEYLLSSVIGYLLGSIPTAYLVLKKTKNIDITNEGSGNVGAMNTFDISKSWILGGIVLLIDAFKGLLSVYIVLLILPHAFIYPALSLFFAVFSHCFNPWLKFKGGRGLASAAGGTALLFPFILFVWGIIWVIVYVMKKDIIFANVWATIMSLIIILTSNQVAYKYTFPRADNTASIIIFSTALFILIFVKHIDPLKEILKNKTLFKKGNMNDKKK
jgi:glycerol-3-phosphate acyltransferase PlsY